MTLGDVRKMVAAWDHLPADTPALLAKDGEGDAYSPLEDGDEGMYLPESGWSGEHYLTEEQRQAKEEPDDHAEAPEGAVHAVFFWPVN